MGVIGGLKVLVLNFIVLELLVKQLRKYFEDSLKWKRERIWCFHLQFEELFWKFGVANEVQNDVKPFNTNSLTSKRNFLANDVCDLNSLLVKTSWILQYISRIFQKHLSRINGGTLKSFENLSLYYYHPFKETMFRTLDLLDLLFELEKDKRVYYHISFKDVDVHLFFGLRELNTFNCASFWRILLFEGMDLRTNPFKGGADGMTQDAQETVELLQGPITRAMTRRIEEEHRGKRVVFEKMIQDLAWQVIGAQEGALKEPRHLIFQVASGGSQRNKFERSQSFKTKQRRRLEPYRR
ncbi:hypothetical protein M9H77_02872 [Catharanthus roseus]|uniref:Uncharacterized protein n=1 Tax=Catharanthus roseus TaxID=4058 RepID=A0ACC0CA27_CATRO|nr:hypothetical protein M9H77_02872 [Catharanthus roseus]